MASYLKHFIEDWSDNADIVAGKRFEKLIDYYSRPDAFHTSIMWYKANVGYSGMYKIEAPTTMLWPEKDPLFDMRWSDRLAEFFTNHSLVTVPVCGHFVPLESPSVFADAIVRQIESVYY